MGDTDPFRAFVVARAGGGCEYCRLIEFATGTTFHVEHVLPRARGGQTTARNLALSCPGCNLAKGDRMEGRTTDGSTSPLFNPRDYEPWILGWHLHFALDYQTGIISSRSPVGEATLLTLHMNHPSRLFARALQIRAGLFA